MGRSNGWAKLPFRSLSGERGGLYIRHSRRDVGGLPASASVFASLGFLEAAATSPLQALPEASEQEHAVSRATELCRSFAEWTTANGRARASGDDVALQAALELGKFGLRLPPPSRRGRLLLHIPVDTRLPRGLLSSLGAADARTGRANDFFAWLAAIGEGAATSGRLQLFLLTHRGATFAVLPDGRNRAKPTLHVFDPLGSTLDAANQQSYVVTFLASRRSGLEFNERSPAEQAEDFFYRRFHHTLKVDKAVVAALASALEETPEAGPAALKAAVRRHAIVEVQMSVEAIYETLVAPQGGSALATPKGGGPRTTRLGTSPLGALPPRPRSLATSPAKGAAGQPWDRALNPRSQSPHATGPPQRRPSQDAEAASPANLLTSPSGSMRPAAAAAAAAAPVPDRKSAPRALAGGAAADGAGISNDRTPLSSPQRVSRSHAGSVAGDFASPPRHYGRRGSTGSVVGSPAGSVAGDFRVSPRSHPCSGHSRRSSLGSEASLFRHVDERVWARPRAPHVSPTSPYSPRMSRRRGGIASDLQQAAAALEADLEAESRSARRHRRAASVAGSTAMTEIPDSFMCKRDPAKLQAAIAKAVGAPAIVAPYSDAAPSQAAGSKQPGGTAAAAAAAASAPSSGSSTSANTNTCARMSDSSGGGEGAASSVRRPSGGAASDVSSALRSSHSDGSNTASNMSTDSAYGLALPDSLRGKGTSLIAGPADNAANVAGGKLSPIPEPAPPLPTKVDGGLLAGLKSVFRWA